MKTKAEWSTEWEVLTYKNDLKDIIGRVQADAVRWAAELCRDEAHKESNVMMSGAIRGMGVIISQQADAIERGGKESGE